MLIHLMSCIKLYLKFYFKLIIIMLMINNIINKEKINVGGLQVNFKINIRHFPNSTEVPTIERLLY